MGLLDHAIREHLELKRRRGADPGEVARQEREALAPELQPSEAEHGDADDFAVEEHPEAPHDLEHHPHDEPRHQAQPVDLSPAGQETAEIDMRSVLEAADEPAPGHHEAAAPAHAHEEPAFGWEMPAPQDAEEPPAEIPGQERLTFE